MKRLLQASILVFILSFAIVGCKSRLASGGAYAPTVTNSAGVVSAAFEPDMAFYVADSGFDLAYSTIDAAFKFEKENRAALWKLSPEIKRTMDALRPKAWQVLQKWAVARKTYLANPIPSNLETLKEVLAEMKRLNATAASVLPK